MQRYQTVEYDVSSPEVRQIYDDFLRLTGQTEVPIWIKSLGGNAVLLKAYWERTKGTLVFGKLPTVLKEMVIFAVSVENGSRYCTACHAHAVLTLDKTLKFEDLNAILDAKDQRVKLPPLYRAAIDFATKVARDPNSITDSDFEALYDADMSDEEVSELLSAIDLAMMFNSYTSTKRLPLDPHYRPILEPVAD